MYRKFIITLATIAFFTACKTSKSSKNIATDSKENVIAPSKYPYKPSRDIKMDILHTKLDVSFDWEKKEMPAQAWLTMKPYFYDQEDVLLDAKAFEIFEIKLFYKNTVQKIPYYMYDSTQLYIKFNKPYTARDTLLIYIKYRAKPEKVNAKGSDAIESDKGLYFITPDSTNPNKPYQIWTQGETQANSCWFPTIDSPNEKCTQEIYITVDKKYKTLSNGELISSTINKDNTRTDYWRQNKPHSVYLFMMAVGEYAVVKDKWRNIPVEYYVEPKYEPYARKIFGKTPAMIEYFSNVLNYPYPWAKYSSVVVRDFVSGAMENTTATVFYEELNRTDRELLDDNGEDIIAHELFHHWFGDLVTCESWAHLPLNESFATYSEYLWAEKEYGYYAAEKIRFDALSSYLDESEYKQEPLIRYNYDEPDDMFDSHSYSKGATILHLLRKTVGDSAFFKSLNVYLTENAYKNTEIHHLRHAFEKVTGQDLNWFFDQWFFKPGHPQLVVEDTLIKDFLVVKIYQEQDTTFTPVYRLPTEITYWIGGEKKVEKITIDSSVDIFKIKVNGEPELVVIDEHGLIPGYLYYINSPNKFYKKYINMYKYSNSYNLTDLALKNLYKYKDSLEVIKIYREALSHPFWKFQITAIEVLEEAKIKDEKEKELIEERIIALAKSSKNTDVRAQALQYLASKNATLYREIFETALKDSSYTVQSNALLALIKIKTINRDSIVNTFKSDDNSAIIQAVSRYFAENGDETCIDWFQEKLKVAKLESKYYIIQNMGKYLAKTNNLNQQIGIKILLPYAKTHQYNWIRYAAFEALYPLVKTHPTLKKELLDIKKEVKSESLKKALEKFKL